MGKIKEFVFKLKMFLFEGYDSLVNNIVKALTIGLMGGLLIGAVPEVRWSEAKPSYWFDSDCFWCGLNVPVALITGAIIAGLLFLKYNSKPHDNS